MPSASGAHSSAMPLRGLGAARHRRMKVLSLAAALLLHACGKAPHHGPPPTEKTPTVGYVVLKPDKVALTTELPGRIAPMLIADVHPQVTGLIQSRNFT